jgi:diguanylate cyclase (GGDEF)-like protein
VGAVHVAEIAKREVAALAIAHEHSSAAKIVTFSAGIASYSAERDKAARDVTARADEALYRAKQLGRNRNVAI